MRQKSGLINCVSSLTALLLFAESLASGFFSDRRCCTDCVMLLLVSTFHLARARGDMHALLGVCLGVNGKASKLS